MFGRCHFPNEGRLKLGKLKKSVFDLLGNWGFMGETELNSGSCLVLLQFLNNCQHIKGW